MRPVASQTTVNSRLSRAICSASGIIERAAKNDRQSSSPVD
jgi:hypothetical protein